jgi:hypothetical protein
MVGSGYQGAGVRERNSSEKSLAGQRLFRSSVTVLRGHWRLFREALSAMAFWQTYLVLRMRSIGSFFLISFTLVVTVSDHVAGSYFR